MRILTVAVAVLLGSLPLAAQDPGPSRNPGPNQDADVSKHVDRLIEQLGGSPREREAAREELLRVGPAAIPALQKAAAGVDQDRAAAARSILQEMPQQEDQEPMGKAEVAIFYHDGPRGVDFVKTTDGHILMSVPEKNAQSGQEELRTYRADSLDDFTKKYPQIAQKYQVRAMASPKEIPDELRRQWDSLEKWLGFQEDPGALETWFELEKDHAGNLPGLWADQENPAGKNQDQGRLGILIRPAGPTLRNQLHLEEGALVVVGVQPKSLAESSGLRMYDIVTALEDQPVKDVNAFREELSKDLKKPQFTLTVLREGKSQKITVTPSHAKPAH